MKLKGSIVLITGAARRVGRAIALDLASHGAKVIAHHNRSQKEAKSLVELAKRKGYGTIKLIQGDLGNLQDLHRVAREAWSWKGRLDVLVNNASTYYPTPLGKLEESQWEDLMAINAKAPYFLSEALGLNMVHRGRGKILFIADWAAYRPYADYVPYCAAKAALLALSKGLARNLAPKVQVNAILPGPVLWPEDMKEKTKKEVLKKTPLGRVGKPQAIASAVRFFIEGNDFMTGSELHVDGGRHIA